MKYDPATVLAHIAYRIRNAPVLMWPFPHIYVTNVFPNDFYRDLLANLPPDTTYQSGKSNYHGRRFADPKHLDILRSAEFTRTAISPFKPEIYGRFGAKPPVYTDLRLVRDCESYSIGPHTDARWKILSYLFYLPPDNRLSDLGTSLYTSNDPNFRCPGGPHHHFDNFTRVYTAPFVPNTLLAFFKTDQAFHGVEPITIPCQRDVLLWNLYDGSSNSGSSN